MRGARRKVEHRMKRGSRAAMARLPPGEDGGDECRSYFNLISFSFSQRPWMLQEAVA